MEVVETCLTHAALRCPAAESIHPHPEFVAIMKLALDTVVHRIDRSHRTPATKPELVVADRQVTGKQCKPSQVLGEGGKDKFILCASWATQSKSTKVPVREEKGPLPH